MRLIFCIQISRLCKTFANNESTNTKLSKTKLSKIVASRGFPGRLLRPLLKTGYHLMKNVLRPLAKSVLILLGLTTAAGVVAEINKKISDRGWVLQT